MNGDFTAQCTADDSGCRCGSGYGLKSINSTNSICVKVWCTTEDANCLCANDVADIDDCVCSYWTTPDPFNPGWCTSETPSLNPYK